MGNTLNVFQESNNAYTSGFCPLVQWNFSFCNEQNNENSCSKAIVGRYIFGLSAEELDYHKIYYAISITLHKAN